jgi:hypothetical protein
MRNTQMTADEAVRAIYIDFEGNMDKAPSVLGVRCHEESTQFVIEPALGSYAGLENSKYRVRRASMETLLEELRRRSNTEDRLVAGFTTHEVGIVDAFCVDEQLRNWFSGAYVNVKKPIDRWVRRQVESGWRAAPEDRSLVSYMPFINLSYKPGCGPGIVGPGLKRLRDQMALHGSASDVSKGTKLHWWRILSHNATDLVATQDLSCQSAEVI